ncbi:MAG: FtsW/RodA/SpoVE family cell cycle protein [Firmicutes bacterium]|nr:FtsW/RodA/SpoVE family cell cycle protein [Bacillota bacterium]
MLSFFTEVSKYLNVLLVFVFTASGLYAVLNKKITKRSFGDFCAYQRVVIVLFNLQSAALIFFNELGGSRLEEFLKMFGIAWVAMLVLSITMNTLHKGSNKILTNSIIFLLSVGIVMLWRISPSNCIRQIWWIAVSVVVMNVVMLALRWKWVYKIPWWVWAGAALGLVVLPFIFPAPENGSLNWVNIKGITFQPSELIKPVLVFMLSVLYVRKKKVTSILMGGCVVGALAVVLLLQNDLGTILIFCSMFLLMVYDYTQREWILIGGVLGVLVCGVVAYRFVGHVQTRVDIWLNPWEDVDGGGYQIAQSLFAIVGGKFMGTGLYQGVPYYIPEAWTDMIFAGICEEFGGIFAALMVMIYLLMALMMFNLVSRYENRLRRNIAMACSIITGIQTILIIGGVIKMLPLTGVTLPLVSYGGTSMISTFIILAIVQELFRSRSQTERKVREYEERKQQAQQGEQAITKPFRFDDPWHW